MDGRHPLLLLPLLMAFLAPATNAASAYRKLPDFIPKCSMKDPEIEKCMLENAKKVLPRLMKGDSQLRLPNLNPVKVTEVNITTGNGPSALDMTCRNIELKGLPDIIMHHIGSKPNVFTMTCTIPHLEITSDYTVDGRVLVLPIKGSGKSNFTFEKAHIYYEQKYTMEKKDNFHFIKYAPSTATFNCSKANFHLENLFNGDKQLGNTVNSFLNENWRAVVDDLGQPFVDASALIIQQFAMAVVGDMPLEEIFNDVAFP